MQSLYRQNQRLQRVLIGLMVFQAVQVGATTTYLVTR